MSTYFYAVLEPIEKLKPEDVDETPNLGDPYNFQVVGKDKEGRLILHVTERW